MQWKTECDANKTQSSQINKNFKKWNRERGLETNSYTDWSGRPPQEAWNISPTFVFLHVRWWLASLTSPCFARGLPSLPSFCMAFILILRAGEALGTAQPQQENYCIINSSETHLGQKEPCTCMEITKHRHSPLLGPCSEHNMASE